MDRERHLWGPYRQRRVNILSIFSSLDLTSCTDSKCSMKRKNVSLDLWVVSLEIYRAVRRLAAVVDIQKQSIPEEVSAWLLPFVATISKLWWTTKLEVVTWM